MGEYILNIKAEYKKDLSSNYLVLEMTGEETGTFALKMLSQNCVDGLLRLEVKMIDEKRYVYYDITGMKTLKEIIENTPVEFDSLKRIYKNIFRLPELLQEYLIDENSILLTPEFIYMDQKLERAECCYYPEINRTLQEQVAELTEYLMNRVDYKDEQAVLSVYALYQMSHESNCTLERLREVFENSSRRDKKEVIENVNIEDKKEVFENIDGRDKREYVCQGKKEWEEKQNWQKERNRRDRQKKRDWQEKKERDQKENFDSQIRKIIPSDEVFYSSLEQIRKENKQESWGKNRQEHKKEDRGETRQENKKEVKRENRKENKKETRRENKKIERKENTKENKRAVKKEIGRETFLNSQGEENKENREIDYPHMEERVESQKEIMRYPLSIYVCAASSLICGAVFLVVLWKAGFLSFAGMLDIKRYGIAVFVYVMLEVMVFLYLFRKKNLCAVIRDTVDYMDWEEYEYESEPIQGMEDFIRVQPVNNYYQDAFLRETSNELKKTELLSEEGIEGNLKTELLVDYREHGIAYLESEITGERIYLKKFPFIIGKLRQGADYVLNNNKISRIHARFLYDEGIYYVEDMDSTNGTNVNGSAISPHERKVVQDQDAISFADKNYVFHR